MKCDCGGTAVWAHPQSGVGVATCKKCGWVVAAYNCPYIPEYLLDNKDKDER
jgi:hypothetical protein